MGEKRHLKSGSSQVIEGLAVQNDFHPSRMVIWRKLAIHSWRRGEVVLASSEI